MPLCYCQIWCTQQLTQYCWWYSYAERVRQKSCLWALSCETLSVVRYLWCQSQNKKYKLLMVLLCREAGGCELYQACHLAVAFTVLTGRLFLRCSNWVVFLSLGRFPLYWLVAGVSLCFALDRLGCIGSIGFKMRYMAFMAKGNLSSMVYSAVIPLVVN